GATVGPFCYLRPGTVLEAGAKAGTFVEIKESRIGAFELSLEERLIRSELARREQADLIRTVNDNTSELIFMKDNSGNLTYANAATLRLIGRSSLNKRAPDSEIISIPAELAVISGNDKLVIKTGQVVEAEETYTGADGVQRTYLSTKSPMRDRSGAIIGVIGVSRDISERLVARERLHRALETAESASAALREADLRKDEFLAMLAHELRGPLAPLRNMVEILKRKASDPHVIASAVGMMERQLGQLVRLVDDLIDVSRITRGQIELRKETVDLSSIILQSVEACRPLAEAANHQLGVTMSPQPIRLHGDPVRLTQVFSNILNNACKYTPPGGKIWLTSEARDGQIVVTVKDSGIGIAPDQLNVIFDLFAQIDRTLERTQSGLGIGLTLVKRLAQMHGGTVDALSKGLGTGTEIVVRLPTINEVRESQAAARTDTQQAGPRRRFLVVDDNEDSAASLAMLLTIDGHEVRTAHDGAAAVEAVESFQPDVVLLDIGLPRLNGYEACQRIRGRPSGPDIVIIALTGWGQDEDRRKSKEAGFDHHMIKPVDYDALKKWLALQAPAQRTG
ncbi:MAG: ATP-binding protein, partial [Steroidobacteraceae bacterium]